MSLTFHPTIHWQFLSAGVKACCLDENSEFNSTIQLFLEMRIIIIALSGTEVKNGDRDGSDITETDSNSDTCECV